jgi:hypothetical protein
MLQSQPDSVLLVNLLAQALMGRARATAGQGDPALADVERGRAMLIRQIERNPQNEKLKKTLRAVEATQASILSIMGRYEEAVHTAQHCADAAEVEPQILVDLASVIADGAMHGAPSGDQSAATRASHQGEYAKEALNLLKRARAAGFTDLEMLNTQDVYASLRSLPGYEEAAHAH